MRVFFDCRFIRAGAHDGISRFSASLFSSLSKTLALTALVSDIRQLDKLPRGASYLLVNNPTNPIAELFLPMKLNRAGAEIVFCPMQTMGSLGKKYKLILTLHDLIYYKHPKPPGEFNWLIKLAWRLYHLSYLPARLLLNRADHVVTISETTRKQISRAKLTSKPVSIVGNASGAKMQANARQYDDKTKTLVYMCSFMEYKNVELLITAMNELPEYRLLLLSQLEPKRQKRLSQLAGSAIQRIEFLNGVSDSQYTELLDSAFALVSASLDEGFGIPLVEAMSRATPIIVSDIEIFREIAASAGNYFDPSNPVDFASRVRQLNNKETWEQASQRALSRSRDFDWDDSAKQLLAIIDSLRA
jgi:glycosyltransferase involved in cell wall biosynthesis